MLLEQKIENIIEQSLNDKGFEIVRVKFSSKILQIMIEKNGGERVSVGDCEKVSKMVSLLLDVEDVLNDKYHLEVSSPGIDRPLVKLKDFQRFVGEEARITLNHEVANRKKLKGIINKVEDKVIYIKPNDENEELDKERTINFW